MKVKLKVIEGPTKGKVFEFDEQDNFILGRDAPGSHAHLRLPPEDKFLSRNHFLLEINPPDCYIRDIGSLNGTFIIREEPLVTGRPSSGVLLFFKGRSEKMDYSWWVKYYMEKYACHSYRIVQETQKIEDGDLVLAGDTLIQITVEQVPSEIPRGMGTLKGVLSCIRCGRDVSHKVFLKEPKDLVGEDFLCDECRKKDVNILEVSKFQSISCFDCGKDITESANSDGRAAKLKDIALYWCDGCASKRKEIQVPNMGNYEILKELGAGGFGIVYLGRDTKTGRIVALKLTKEKVKKNEEMILRFKREISIMKELDHPNLVKLYDEGIHEDRYYFVSEYMPDGNMADLSNRHGSKIPYREVCQLFSDALAGLSYFHSKGYVHRDIKPENILLRKADNKYIAKIADFGLARSYAVHGGTITQPGEWAGTIFYCPPEQIINFKKVKPPTDIYSIGMSMYVLITGKFPYEFPSKREFFEMISRGKKPRDPVEIILGPDKPVPVEKNFNEIPAELARAINRAIEKNESERFDSAEEFRKILMRFT